jgi:C4-dicarboxylate-specific signal transduction histidine kinase
MSLTVGRTRPSAIALVSCSNSEFVTRLTKSWHDPLPVTDPAALLAVTAPLLAVSEDLARTDQDYAPCSPVTPLLARCAGRAPHAARRHAAGPPERTSHVRIQCSRYTPARAAAQAAARAGIRRVSEPESGAPRATGPAQPMPRRGVQRDLTERKRAEAALRDSDQRYREAMMELSHANRVMTVGQLTASIAHEVNQPIAAAVTNAGAALRWLGTPGRQTCRKHGSHSIG